MGCCPHCQDAEDVFGKQSAEDDLKDYRKKGAANTTRWLIDGLLRAGVEEKTLLDIGGGIGAISLALLDAGAAHATDVDASSAYIQVAQDEAQRQQVRDNMTYHHGDFVQLAPEIDAADIVTLDRVVCCYPDMPALIGASTSRARQYYGLVFPRDNVLMRLGEKVINLFGFRLPGRDFRIYIHRTDEVDAHIQSAGFALVMQRKSWLWQVRLYERVAGTC